MHCLILFYLGFFEGLGGISKALFTTQGTNYIVGLVCLCSATALDLKVIVKVLKKQGILLGIKVILCIIFSFLFLKMFGMGGVLGISAIALIPTLCSINPSLYLALETDYGEESDQAAFGLTGLLCVPAFPLLVFSLTMGGQVDWTPIISTLIPIGIGILIGNTDRDLAKFLGQGVKVLTLFMGWSFGAGINIISALKSGPQGILLTILFYILMLPIIYLIETKILKQDGISAFSITSVAGLSVAIPNMISETYPEYLQYVDTSTAQIAFAVVLSSIITPALVKVFADKKGIEKHIEE